MIVRIDRAGIFILASDETSAAIKPYNNEWGLPAISKCNNYVTYAMSKEMEWLMFFTPSESRS